MKLPIITLSVMIIALGLLSFCARDIPQSVLDECNSIAVGDPDTFKRCVENTMSR